MENDKLTQDVIDAVTRMLKGDGSRSYVIGLTEADAMARDITDDIVMLDPTYFRIADKRIQ